MLPPKRTINLFFKNGPSRFYLRHTYTNSQHISFVEKFVFHYYDKPNNKLTTTHIDDLIIDKEIHSLFFVKEKDLILYVEEGEYYMSICSSRIDINKKEHSITSSTKVNSFFDGEESF